MDNKELLGIYTKMYNNENVSNPILSLHIYLSNPTGYLFWLYFATFNFVNFQFIVSIFEHCDGNNHFETNSLV